MHSHIFSFIECGHRVSKHVDGHNSEITVNLGLYINPGSVISENYNKMLQ